MKDAKMKEFQKRLQAVRGEILKVINWRESSEEKGDALDEIDQANDLIEKEMGYLMSSNMATNLEQVDEALNRIKRKEYGACLHCGEEINIKRLELIPFAKFCIKCQEELEKKAR